MKVTFLGTGTSQGIPVIACKCEVCKSRSPKDKRLRASVMIETGSMILVIDAGPDFRQQLLRENVQHLDALLITHQHHDHIGGLDDVRSFNYLQKKAVDVYASLEAQEVIRRNLDYAFGEEKYPGVPEIHLHEVTDALLDLNGTKIIPIRLRHYNMQVFGYRIGDLAYLTDLNEIAEEEIAKLNGVKVVILAALRKKIHYSHMNLEQALALLERIGPEKAYLTHISHLMGLHKEVEKELPANVRLAYDGLTIEL